MSRAAHRGGGRRIAPWVNRSRKGRSAAPAPRCWRSAQFEDLVALASDKRDVQAKLALERDVRLVRCEDGQLEIALEPTAARSLVNDLSRKLQQWTGRRWVVVISREAGLPTLRSDRGRPPGRTGGRGARDPLVKAVLERFPGAQIVGVRGPGDEAPPQPDDPPLTG